MPVTNEQVKHARAVAAEIVATHDAKYTPLFDILNQEVERREARTKLIQRAIANIDLAQQRKLRRMRRTSQT